MSFALNLRLPQGTSRDWPLQAYNRDGTPASGTFESSDVLACSVWPGDGQPTILSPAITWIDAGSGQFQISLNNSDTAAIAPSIYRILATATCAGRSASLLPPGSTFEILDVPGSASTTSLITQDYLAASLAAGQAQLTSDDGLELVIRAASRAIRRYCNRYFNRGGPRSTIPAYDGLYAVDWPSRTILLRQYPLNAPPRVRMNPTVVLTVFDSATSMNQMATVTMQTDGAAEDVDDVPPATTGLVLYRMASAVASSATLTWASYPTMSALAAAIAGLGNGWQATVESGYELWPTADFRVGQGTQPVLGFQSQVGCSVHIDDVPCIYDVRSGIVTLSEQVNDPFTSPRFGMYLQTDVDDVQVYGGPQGLRVTYDAGWDTVPEEVQEACVETVLDWLQKKSLDQNLGSESDGAVLRGQHRLRQLCSAEIGDRQARTLPESPRMMRPPSVRIAG